MCSDSRDAWRCDPRVFSRQPQTLTLTWYPNCPGWSVGQCQVTCGKVADRSRSGPRSRGGQVPRCAQDLPTRALECAHNLPTGHVVGRSAAIRAATSETSLQLGSPRPSAEREWSPHRASLGGINPRSAGRPARCLPEERNPGHEHRACRVSAQHDGIDPPPCFHLPKV
jgi:hypothetical protein